jgi:hypothetical protein
MVSPSSSQRSNRKGKKKKRISLDRKTEITRSYEEERGSREQSVLKHDQD